MLYLLNEARWADHRPRRRRSVVDDGMPKRKRKVPEWGVKIALGKLFGLHIAANVAKKAI